MIILSQTRCHAVCFPRRLQMMFHLQTTSRLEKGAKPQIRVASSGQAEVILGELYGDGKQTVDRSVAESSTSSRYVSQVT